MPGDPTATIPPAGHVKVGLVGRAFQLEGGVRLRPASPAAALALDQVERVFVVGFGPVTLRKVRNVGGGPVLYLEGVRDREAAQRLTGAAVFVPAEAVPDAAPGGPAALEGAEVHCRGRVVGRVREVRADSSNPLLVIVTPAGERLIPLAAPYVVARGERVELVDPPEGLLDPA